MFGVEQEEINYPGFGHIRIRVSKLPYEGKDQEFKR